MNEFAIAFNQLLATCGKSLTQVAALSGLDRAYCFAVVSGNEGQSIACDHRPSVHRLCHGSESVVRGITDRGTWSGRASAGSGLRFRKQTVGGIISTGVALIR